MDIMVLDDVDRLFAAFRQVRTIPLRLESLAEGLADARVVIGDEDRVRLHRKHGTRLTPGRSFQVRLFRSRLAPAPVRPATLAVPSNHASHKTITRYGITCNRRAEIQRAATSSV